MKYKLVKGWLTDAEMERMDEDLKSEPYKEFTRASGECICLICSLTYYKHPRLDPDYFLHLLCDGRLVKL